MYYLTKICCFCLNVRVKLINLNKKSPKNKSIFKKLYFCYNKNFYFDLIPTFICVKCCAKLETAYDFKKMCFGNFSKYHSYVKQLQYVNMNSKTRYVFNNVKILVSDFRSKNLDSTIGRCLKEKVEYLITENKEVSEEDVMHKDQDEEVIEDSSSAEDSEEECNNGKSAAEDKIIQISYKVKSILNTRVKQQPEASTSNQHLVENPFNCPQCNRLFTSKSKLNQHSITHINKKYPCLKCGDFLSSKKNLRRHKRETHSPKASTTKSDSLTCSTCGKIFVSPSNLKRHIRMLHDRNTLFHLCPICGNQYKNKSTLSEHLLKHNNKEVYPCEICGKKYPNPNLRRAHTARNHKESDEKKTCTVCGKIFACQSYLDFHLKTHSSDALFSCEKCDTKFKYEVSLKRHLETIHIEDPQRFKCSACGNNYSTSESLKKHSRSHDIQLPYPCTICTKTFSRRDKLKKHVLKRHTKPKKSKHSSTSVDAEEFLLQHVIKSEPRDEEVVIEEVPFGIAFKEDNYIELKKEESE